MGATMSSDNLFEQSQRLAISAQQPTVSRNCHIEGYLYKQSEHLKRWRRRWFSLDVPNRCLTYKNSQEDMGVRGRMHFVDGTSVGLRPPPPRSTLACFYIDCGGQHYDLAADSAAEAEHWIAALVEALRDAPSVSPYSEYGGDRTSNEGEGSPTSGFSGASSSHQTPPSASSYHTSLPENSPYALLPPSTLPSNAALRMLAQSTPGKAGLRSLSKHEHDHIIVLTDMMQHALAAKEVELAKKEQEALGTQMECEDLRKQCENLSEQLDRERRERADEASALREAVERGEEAARRAESAAEEVRGEVGEAVRGRLAAEEALHELEQERDALKAQLKAQQDVLFRDFWEQGT